MSYRWGLADNSTKAGQVLCSHRKHTRRLAVVKLLLVAQYTLTFAVVKFAPFYLELTSGYYISFLDS